ncbi:MAG TPA: lytic transglycosylase domain-containing protein [Desulfotignum sp.]|nr:lytic transglycosylase domain-containing protein [Desulfotignum sp.]
MMYDNGIDRINVSSVSGKALKTCYTPEQKEPGLYDFSNLLKTVTTGVEPDAVKPEQPSNSLKKEAALALFQQVTLQMNASLLDILADGENKDAFAGTSLQDGFGEMISKEMPLQPSVSPAPTMSSPSTSGRAASENSLSEPPAPLADPAMGDIGKSEIRVSGIHGIDGIIQSASQTYEIDAGLIRRVIQAESSFNPDALSPVGAQGLMQLMPETAKELGVSDAFDPKENIMGGTRYLRQLLDRYDQDLPLALAAYNWGMGNVDAEKRPMPEETRNYIARITGVSLS